MSKKCPTKHKIAHPTKEAAQKHAGGLYARQGKVALVHVYKCSCGAWHVGGRRKRIGRRR
jgi:hypothetical protein